MEPVVLVIDDDPGARRAIERVLRGVCRVESIDDGAVALERLRSGARFALVLCDVTMPGTTGLDVADWLRREGSPQLDRFVFVTGGARSPRDQARLAASGIHILDKPFGRAQLLAVVAPYLAGLTDPSRCHPEEDA